MKKHTIYSRVNIALAMMVLLVTFLFGTPVQAQGGDGPTDPVELEAFVDGIMAVQLADMHVAGATISVVKDGKVFLAKGYGYADVDARVPVDPEISLFRVGSVTKLFTWTAVMQLVEQGVLDLNADVNTYLDFKIPSTYLEPITMVHLLTHTPGFEDRSYGLAASSPEKLVPNGEWLAKNIPARVRPPGQFSSYSNYGTALAGYIVEKVAYMPYDEYVERNIFEPLEMGQTTSRQPLPDLLAEDMSAGYRYVDGAYQQQDFELINPAPAGSVSASAADMARFMIAHLQDGRFGEARILEEATAQQMHSRLFTHHERLNGFAHGFYEMSQNGQHIIGHAGDTTWFHSLLALFPEHDLGLFVSYNSEGAPLMQEYLLEAFVDHYFPITASEALIPPDDFKERGGRFTGSYRLNRSSYTTAEKVVGLFSPFVIQVTEDGALVLNSMLGKWRFVEVEPLIFQEVEGNDWLIFREDEQRVVTHAFLNSLPMMGLEKLAWYEASSFHYILLIVCFTFFLSVLIAAPIGYFVNRVRGDVEPQPLRARLARWVMIGIVVLNLLLVIGFGVAFSDLNAFMVGEAPILNLLIVVPVLLLVLTLAAAVFCVLAWKDGYWHISGRVHYTLVTLASVAIIWFLAYWNLLFAGF